MKMSDRYAIALLAVMPLALLTVDAAWAGEINATCTPGPCNAWKATDVTLKWELIDILSTNGCEILPPPFTQEGTHTETCAGTDVNGSLSRTAIIKVDKTAPRVTNVVPTVGANAFGWHTSPLAFSFAGTDTSQAATTSGIVTCTQATYGGPDTYTGSVEGTCRDRAGNVSAPFTHTFKYDATPPVLAPLGAVADDRMVTLRWARSEAPVEITRTPGIAAEAASIVYRGPAASFVDTKVKNGTTYRYRATVTDVAGHIATQVVTARPVRGLLQPVNGARLTTAPRLAWTHILNADYYNVQLFRGSRKILSVWPKSTAYALRSGWRFRGERFRLTPGTYRVYIWPGFGAFAQQRYGRIVGSRTFVVRRR